MPDLFFLFLLLIVAVFYLIAVIGIISFIAVTLCSVALTLLAGLDVLRYLVYRSNNNEKDEPFSAYSVKIADKALNARKRKHPKAVSIFKSRHQRKESTREGNQTPMQEKTTNTSPTFFKSPIELAIGSDLVKNTEVFPVLEEFVDIQKTYEQYIIPPYLNSYLPLINSDRTANRQIINSIMYLHEVTLETIHPKLLDVLSEDTFNLILLIHQTLQSIEDFEKISSVTNVKLVAIYEEYLEIVNKIDLAIVEHEKEIATTWKN